MRMRKPKGKFETAHLLYGVDIRDKEVVEVPEHLVSLFKAQGFKEVVKDDEGQEKEEKKKRRR